jgi:membrane protein DedA with SNARE-associated domain
MIENVLAALATFAISVITSMGYAGIVLLMAIESACIPLPSEIIMPFAGYMVSLGTFSLVGVATAAAIGENIGAAIAYQLGKSGGRPLVEKYGPYILIDAGHLDQADRFFARYGSIAALVGRLLPVVRTFIAFPAGVAGMNRFKFHLYTTIGSWPWCFGLAWIGMKLGDKWNSDPRIKAAFHSADVVIVAVVLAAVAFFVWHRLKGRKKH